MHAFDPDNPRSFGEIYAEIMREVREFGFLGTADTPVELDRRPQSHILHALYHLHIQGKCYKNKSGVFCGTT